MGWIDVAIPGVIGLMLAVSPRLFFRATENAEKDAGRARLLRGLGLLLLVVAAGLLLIKLASGN